MKNANGPLSLQLIASKLLILEIIVSNKKTYIDSGPISHFFSPPLIIHIETEPNQRYSELTTKVSYFFFKERLSSPGRQVIKSANQI